MKAYSNSEEEYNDDPINEDDFRDENGNLDNNSLTDQVLVESSNPDFDSFWWDW